MAGAIAFDRALAVLIITPEFFLPLRQLAIRYHAGAAGRAAARAGLRDPRRAAARAPGRSRRGGAAPSLPSRPTPLPSRPTPRIRFDGRLGHLPRPATSPRCEASTSTLPPGRAGRARRRQRGRQVDGREPPAPLHRAGRRRGSRSVGVPLGSIDRRRPGARTSPGSRSARTCSTGRVADNIRLARPDARATTTVRGGRRGGRRRRVHRGACRGGYDDARRRGRRAAQRRPAPAHRDRPGVPARRAAWSSSTSRPRTSTPRARRPSARPSGGSRRGATVLVIVAPPAAGRGRRPRWSCSTPGGSSRPGRPADLLAARRRRTAGCWQCVRPARRRRRDHLPARSSGSWPPSGGGSRSARCSAFLAIGSNVALMAISAYLISKAALVTNVAEVALAITARARAGHLARRVPLPRAVRRPTAPRSAILTDLRVWFFALDRAARAGRAWRVAAAATCSPGSSPTSRPSRTSTCGSSCRPSSPAW